jgi:hypothetical protein
MTGELVRGRCRSPNLCAYCARLAAIEWTEMLAIDAMTSAPPVVWACLGTRTATLDTRGFYRARENVIRRVRRWAARKGLGRPEYLCIVEFTTGYGPRSSGLRRPHWNVLLKGVPIEFLGELRPLVVETWCKGVDADPEAQHVDTVTEAGGLMRYLALHFLKESQVPPRGWKGHRVIKSRGYFSDGVDTTREEAKRSLAVKREVWKLEQQGCPLEVAIDLARASVAERERHIWLFVSTSTPWSGLPAEVAA